MTPTAKTDAIVAAVKSRIMTQEEALKALGDLMKKHPKSADYASNAVSDILGMPEEPREPTAAERERAVEYFAARDPSIGW